MTFQPLGTPLTRLRGLFSRRTMGTARGENPGMAKVIALAALKPYQGGEGALGALAFEHFNQSANPAWDAFVSCFIYPHSGVAGAALPGAARHQLYGDPIAPHPDQSRLDCICGAGRG